jgi:uncharacterized protein YqeY
MSKMLNVLKADLLNARKDKNTTLKALLIYVLGEVQRQRIKDESDEAVLKVISGVDKRLRQALKIKSTTVMEEEIKILSTYLPSKLDSKDLESLIKKLSSKYSKIGEVMKALKEESKVIGFSYNGKLAMDLVKGIMYANS